MRGRAHRRVCLHHPGRTRNSPWVLRRARVCGRAGAAGRRSPSGPCRAGRCPANYAGRKRRPDPWPRHQRPARSGACRVDDGDHWCPASVVGCRLGSMPDVAAVPGQRVRDLGESTESDASSGAGSTSSLTAARSALGAAVTQRRQVGAAHGRRAVVAVAVVRRRAVSAGQDRRPVAAGRRLGARRPPTEAGVTPASSCGHRRTWPGLLPTGCEHSDRDGPAVTTRRCRAAVPCGGVDTAMLRRPNRQATPARWGPDAHCGRLAPDPSPALPGRPWNRRGYSFRVDRAVRGLLGEVRSATTGHPSAGAAGTWCWPARPVAHGPGSRRWT